MTLKAILFDLDGTLVDTAPDLCGTIVDMQKARDLPITPIEDMTHLASGGARALLGKGFGLTLEHPDFAGMRQEFLTRYEGRIAQQSRIYDGVLPLLHTLQRLEITWGVVTNKPFYLAKLLLAQLTGLESCAVLIGGDSASAPKPSPAPCLMASDALKLPPEHCLMVGDDDRDIQAGRAAGMQTAAVSYGYIASDIAQWQAHHIFSSPAALEQWLCLQF